MYLSIMMIYCFMAIISVVQSWRFECAANTKIDATLGFCNHEGYVNENCNDTSSTSNNKKTISTTTKGAIKQPLTTTRTTGQPPSTRETSIQPLQIWRTTTTTITTTQPPTTTIRPLPGKGTEKQTVPPSSLPTAESFKIRGIDNFRDFVAICKRNYASLGKIKIILMKEATKKLEILFLS